ncbi:MAG: hypothetical protein WAR22_14230 [Desulfomonilia bacterium]
MSKRYTRQMSFNERIYAAMDEVCPPIYNQLIFEGEGVLDPGAWLRAVDKASEANPGSRLVLKGFLGLSRWVDSGLTPRVREVHAPQWDGFGPVGAPFLEERLLFREGPTCEVVLIHGDIPRVAFRTHHAVMDGRGTLTWAEDVFRALRGENVIGSSSTLTDVEMVKSFQNRKRKPFPPEHLSPTGTARGNERGVVWKRARIRGSFARVLPRCAVLLAREARSISEGVVRFGVPVDLRRHRKDLRSTANLSFALYIEVKPDTTEEQIAQDLAFQLEHGYEGMLSRGDELFRHLPMRLIRSQGLRIIAARHASGRYSLSGVLSNLGRIDPKPFEGGGFKAVGFWAIPPRNEYHPLFLAMMGYEDCLELILSMPAVLASGGRMDAILDGLVRGMK